jgi:hypothetical protein
MLNPVISIEGQSVLSHGTLVSYAKQEIDIYPFSPSDEIYRIQLVFKEEPGANPSYRIAIVGDRHISVTFVNFDRGISAATSQPIYVANYGQEKLLLNIASSLVGQGETGTRILSYTFLLGGSVDGI